MAQRTVQPGSPEAVRAEIEQTRARMSATLDEIEGALVHTKEQIRESLDIQARIRQKPLQAVGAVFGTGLLLGLLTGGGGSGKKERREREQLEARAEQWEERAKRLLAISQAQEDEIESLQGAVTDAEARARRAVRRAALRAEAPPADLVPPRRSALRRTPEEIRPARSRLGVFSEQASERIRSRAGALRAAASERARTSRRGVFSESRFERAESRFADLREVAADRAHRLAEDARHLRERLVR